MKNFYTFDVFIATLNKKLNNIKPTKGIIVIISAPSGAGKSSIIKGLINRNHNISFCVSHTTREMRYGEIEGKDYYFISINIFNEMINDKKIVEFTINFDNMYGTSTDEIMKLTKMGKYVICDIDENGHKNIIEFANKQQIPVIKIWIEVDKNEIIKRLQGRGDNVEKRINSIQDNYLNLKKYDFIVTNNNLDDAIYEIEKILHDSL